MLKLIETVVFYGDSDFSRGYSSTRRILGTDESKKVHFLLRDLVLPAMLFAHLQIEKISVRNVIAAGKTMVWYVGKQRGWEVEEV